MQELLPAATDQLHGRMPLLRKRRFLLSTSIKALFRAKVRFQRGGPTHSCFSDHCHGPGIPLVPPRHFGFHSGTGRNTRVSSHFQIVENRPDIASELPHLSCHAGYTFGLDDSNGKASKTGDGFRTVADANPVAIFIVVPFNDVVAAILNSSNVPDWWTRLFVLRHPWVNNW